jgi:transcriptional regulator with XRE-family HTH domain
MADILRIVPAPSPAPSPEPLWREVLGDRLREERLDRGQTLTDTATRAGISPQYLSEIERGLKDPSSEMIAAVAGALELTLVDLTTQVADQLERATSPSRGVVALAA